MLVLLLTSMLTLPFNTQQVIASTPPQTQWSKTYGGTSDDKAFSVVQTSDGGYALAGVTYSYGAGAGDTTDFWLVRTDSFGNMLWSKTYGRIGDDKAFSVVQTSDGGYALAGVTYSYGAGAGVTANFWLVKTDSVGNMLWSKTYGGTGVDEAFSVVQTSDGGYAIAGSTMPFGASGDFWLVKTDSVGNMLWSKTYGGTENDIASSVVQTSDGGYAIAGMTSCSAGGYDFWLVRTDSFGNMLWSKTYGRIGDDEAFSVVQTSDGGYALAGVTYSYGASGDFWLVKTDSVGNMLWSKTYGGTGDDEASSVIQTSDGGYMLAGYTYSYGAGVTADFWVIKTNSSGDMLWSKTYGGTSYEWAFSVVQTSDGGYAIAGYTQSYGAGSLDFWLIKLAPEAGPSLDDLSIVEVEPIQLILDALIVLTTLAIFFAKKRFFRWHALPFFKSIQTQKRREDE